MQITPGPANSITVAGVTLIDTGNLIVLCGYNNGANDNTTMRRPGGSSGYQIPTGKTLKVKAVRVTGYTTTAQYAQFRQSDNDVGLSTGTSFTNAVNLPAGISNAIVYTPTSGGVPRELGVQMEVAAGKYLSFTTSSGTDDIFVEAFGYLE